MKISVVVPTHYRPTELKNLLLSLEVQKYNKNDFEVIIVASPKDSASEIIEKTKAESNLNLCCVEIPNDPFKGASASAKRNYGVSQAKGEWIAFIDDDCVADENWLSSASKHFDEDIVGIEGQLRIPPLDKPTLTYKGLLRMTKSGGYQTCNMFYKKSSFQSIGGFDLNFPYYLEDTDLAWSLLEQGGKIVFCKDAVVMHPVPQSDPYKLIIGALRTKRLVYLYKKHPDLYKKSTMESFRFSYRCYLALYVGLFFSLIISNAFLAFVFSLGLLILLSVHVFKMFYKCRFDLKELVLTSVYTLVVPLVSFVQLIHGMIRYKTIVPL